MSDCIAVVVAVNAEATDTRAELQYRSFSF